MRARLYRGRYYATWTEAGKTVRQALHTADRAEAERRLADLISAYGRPGHTVADIVEAYIIDKEHTAGADRARYAWKALAPTFGNLRPDQIDRALCRRYVATRPVQRGTVIRELIVLRAALRWQDRNTPAVIELPAAPPPRDRHLTREEYRRLLDAAVTPHVRLFIVLALATAGRASALLDLTWDRVDFVRGVIRLADDSERRRKGRATVPMTDTARRALEEAQRAALSDYVIEYAGGPVGSIKKAFWRTARKADLDDVSPHVLRHTAAVWMVEAGVALELVGQYLGHTSPSVTYRVYARYQPDFMREAARALEVR